MPDIVEIVFLERIVGGFFRKSLLPKNDCIIQVQTNGLEIKGIQTNLQKKTKLHASSVLKMAFLPELAIDLEHAWRKVDGNLALG